MAWGQRGGKGVEDLVQRLQCSDPNLTSLNIFPTRKFGHQEIVDICRALDSNTVLRDLYASGRRMTPESAAVIADMLARNRSLQSLCVGDHEFGDAGVQALVQGLQHNSTLQRLDLENKGIGPAGAASIASALLHRKQLLSLSLANNPLTSAGVHELQPGLIKLQELDLRDCAINAQGAEALGRSLKDSACRLEVLHLEDNDLGPEAGKALAAGLWQCQALRQLHLCNTGIGDEGTCKLAQALPQATCLTYLDLSSCNIGDSGASDLADAIADPFFSIHNKAALTEEFHGQAPIPASIQVLKLRDNKIGEQGVQELGEAMQQSSTVQELDIAGNQVGKGGVQALAAADALQRLCLFNCQIGKDVAMQLVTSFQSNAFSSLQELDLSGNNIQTPEMETLLITLQEQGCRQALKVLIIGGNPGTQGEGFETQVAKAREARTGLDIAWQATDPGQNSNAETQ